MKANTLQSHRLSDHEDAQEEELEHDSSQPEAVLIPETKLEEAHMAAVLDSSAQQPPFAMFQNTKTNNVFKMAVTAGPQQPYILSLAGEPVQLVPSVEQTVFFATDREFKEGNDIFNQYDGKKQEEKLGYGSILVRIPLEVEDPKSPTGKRVRPMGCKCDACHCGRRLLEG